jgi:hypothetical protein
LCYGNTAPDSGWIMSRNLLLCLGLALGIGGGGCASLPAVPGWGAVPQGNPIFVPVAHDEFVWERAVDVLHDYQFEIARENKLDGIIETDFKVGSSILEPWHGDSVGLANRLESTFQSIRRRVFVSVTPAEGGFLVGVEAFKDIEDLPGLAATSPGGATFLEDVPLHRDLNLVVGQTTPSGWVPLDVLGQPIGASRTR